MIGNDMAPSIWTITQPQTFSLKASMMRNHRERNLLKDSSLELVRAVVDISMIDVRNTHLFVRSVARINSFALSYIRN
jgi:hypothetical protein